MHSLRREQQAGNVSPYEKAKMMSMVSLKFNKAANTCSCTLRNSKHVPCFYQVIETRV